MKNEAPILKDDFGVVAKGDTSTVLERYELKYAIPGHLIDEISQFISPYCFLDKYSEQSPDTFYTVNSLYFDTPDFLFIRSRLARAHRRFNLRIRSYGDNPQLPYFLEVKQKRDEVVKKIRAKLFDADLNRILNDPVSEQFLTGDGEACGRADFLRLINIYNAKPQVLVQYRRKAYISRYEAYARVTFDMEMRYMEQHDYSVIPIEERLSFCDTATGFDTESSVILELKCYASFVPLWMIDCVRKFQLHRRSFSKYSICMMPIFNQHKCTQWDAQSVFMDYKS